MRWTSDDGRATLYLGDCLDVMPTLDEEVAAVITDPPYGVKKGAAFVRAGGAVVGNGAEAMNETDDAYAWIRYASPLVVPGGHIASFYDMADYIGIAGSLERHGFERWNEYALVKQAPPPTPRPTFVSAFEMAVVAARKGEKRNWYGSGYVPNRWIGQPGTVGPERTGHTAQKPLEPMQILVSALTPSGGLVLDPFAGSGTTGVAALRQGRTFIGIEREPEYFEIACTRVDQEARQGRLGL